MKPYSVINPLSGADDSFYDTITTPEYDNAMNHGSLLAEDPEDRMQQEAEWRSELEKVSVFST